MFWVVCIWSVRGRTGKNGVGPREISQYMCVSLNRIDTVNCAKLIEGSLLWTVDARSDVNVVDEGVSLSLIHI